MTISYNWISEYIPVPSDPERIGKILTSIGLEVESMEPYESIRGGLNGLVAGEVKACTQHPAADKLRITQVDTGSGNLLQIVCGAPNVAVGQKVVVAKAGTIIYPLKGDPVTIKTAKIRGEESQGMICAEDEIGVGESHEGIIVLPGTIHPGSELASFYKPYTDWIYEIGLTPNRMDAMSHLGVARDVCAYLSHHDKKDIRVKYPFANGLISSGRALPFSVEIENTRDCKRYCGISLVNIEVKPSPKWLQDKLKSIGQRPINNIVDITNYILHDTGQPLHAFDTDRITGNRIIVKNLPEGTPFKTLDEKERKLSAEDLMICDGNSKGLCIAGVFGGMESGVQPATRNIFLESAWFNPVSIRKTSFRHGLRTDASSRFEKNVDISNTLQVLKRAAAMIVEIAGGEIASDPVDVYPNPEEKTEVVLKYHYLKKLSGKNYHPDTIARILQSLGFEIIKEGMDDLRLAVPFSKPDVTMQADVLEEIMRIDGYDNIDIPKSITITPSVGASDPSREKKEKAAGFLVGAGFQEIFTNSITNAAYFDGEEPEGNVRLLNNLSAVHNIMRPSMLETGLESIAYNIHRKNNDLRFFEFGKTYHSRKVGEYREEEHLCLYITGQRPLSRWKGKSETPDIYYLKGMTRTVLTLLGVSRFDWASGQNAKFSHFMTLKAKKEILAEIGSVGKPELDRFDIRQDVYFADIRWKVLEKAVGNAAISYHPLPNQLPVFRDLAIVVENTLPYEAVEASIHALKLSRLRSVELFDVFESEKLGAAKKSFAISFSFRDDEKTLTDKETDSMMTSIMRALEQDLGAEIRKGPKIAI